MRGSCQHRYYLLRLDSEVLRTKHELTRLKAYQFLNLKFCSSLPTALRTGMQHDDSKGGGGGDSRVLPAEGERLHPCVALEAVNRVLSSL